MLERRAGAVGCSQAVRSWPDGGQSETGPTGRRDWSIGGRQGDWRNWREHVQVLPKSMTMKLPRALTCALFLLSLPLTAAQTWKVDPNHSRIGFTISHLGISEITGDFRKYTVTVAASEEDFSDAVFELAIDASSIDTAVEKRDAHLKSPDFFDVSNHAKITFRTRSIKP